MLDSPAYAVSPRFTAGEVEDSLYLLGGRELLTIGLGSAHRTRLRGLLAGAFTAGDLRREFPADASAVVQLIDRLIERKVVVPTSGASADLSVPLDEAERNGGDRSAIGDPLAPSAVGRIGIVGDTDVPLLDAVLAAFPTVTRVDPESADLVLAFASPAFLTEFNRRAIGARQRWLPVPSFDGRFQRIGPVIVPGVSACFECANSRWASTTAFPDRYAAVSGAARPGRRDASLDATVLGFALRYAVRWLYGHDWLVASNLLVYEPKVFEAGAHPVFRVARCTACGPTAGEVYPWRA
ncbi:TOMM precursor leader peptide-binding protein [Planctomonas psychrotolerans]|uniref:TOMM precursor leader peptide-binding protein n=1 Tax=Planctomonas psychrotolerans TaxID=2528712 RepID=UPI001238D3F2|nr:TOMM precursor leader peptide-binding protein [Planctomonas psychrotolerans]